MIIEVDTTQALNTLTEDLGRRAGRHALRSAAIALTRTAQAVRTAEYHEMRDVFRAPTPWTLSAVYVLPATPAKLEATVGLKNFAGKGIPATKFLAAQIAGGQRRLKRFELALRHIVDIPQEYRAVPGSGARRDRYGNIAPSQIVQVLAYLRAFPEAGYIANRAAKARARRAKSTRPRQGESFFVGRIGSSPLGVWARTGSAKGLRVRPIIIFVRHAQYEAIYDFEFVATTTAHREFPRQFESTFREAYQRWH
jgi:hypothetical protein